jgi:pimeloyl-ACP methyl ester carboxylesterase
VPPIFDPLLAYQFAKVCQAVYDGDEETIASACNVDVAAVRTKRIADDYAAIAAMGNYSLVIFCGTCNLGGWLSDLRGHLRAFPGLPGKVHHGAASAFAGFVGWLAQHLGQGEVQLCGHSRGGWHALFAAAALQGKNVVRPVYTYGSPRPGDATFAASLKVEVHRLVNDLDPVPHEPPEWFLGYTQPGQEHWLDSDGMIGNRPGLARQLRAWVSHARLGLRQGALSVLSDHAMTSYVLALEKNLPPLAA